MLLDIALKKCLGRTTAFFKASGQKIRFFVRILTPVYSKVSIMRLGCSRLLEFEKKTVLVVHEKR